MEIDAGKGQDCMSLCSPVLDLWWMLLPKTSSCGRLHGARLARPSPGAKDRFTGSRWPRGAAVNLQLGRLWGLWRPTGRTLKPIQPIGGECRAEAWLSPVRVPPVRVPGQYRPNIASSQIKPQCSVQSNGQPSSIPPRPKCARQFESIDCMCGLH